MAYPATVKIDYTNWRGERSQRWVLPTKIEFTCNEWHKEPQWLLTALDLEKDAVRTFAMTNIHSWQSE